MLFNHIFPSPTQVFFKCTFYYCHYYYFIVLSFFPPKGAITFSISFLCHPYSTVLYVLFFIGFTFVTSFSFIILLSFSFSVKRMLSQNKCVYSRHLISILLQSFLAFVTFISFVCLFRYVTLSSVADMNRFSKIFLLAYFVDYFHS